MIKDLIKIADRFDSLGLKKEADKIDLLIAKASSDNQNDIASRVLQIANLYGFGGECAETAIAINDVLFNGEGRIVAAVNKWLWESERRMVGHVAVEYGDMYWDAEGQKNWEDIESWGMLDEEDPDYDFGDDPEEKINRAYEVEKIYPTREDLLESFGGCNLGEKKKILSDVKDSL